MAANLLRKQKHEYRHQRSRLNACKGNLLWLLSSASLRLWRYRYAWAIPFRVPLQACSRWRSAQRAPAQKHSQQKRTAEQIPGVLAAESHLQICFFGERNPRRETHLEGVFRPCKCIEAIGFSACSQTPDPRSLPPTSACA